MKTNKGENMKIRLIALSIGLVIFCVLVSANAQPTWTQTGWQNFKQLPINLHELGIYDATTGDVLHSETGATLVAISNKEALYLDFNLAVTGKYVVLDDTSQEILNIIKYAKSGKSLIDTQFKLWSYLGVDEESLQVVWTKAYGRTDADWYLLKPTLNKYRAMSIGIDLTNAINNNQISSNFESNGYSSVDMYLENTKEKPIAIDILIGTKLDNGNGANQNIGLGETIVVYIPEKMSKQFTIKSYCINAHKGVPAESDNLAANGKVERHIMSPMLDAFKAGTVSAGESQQAVWKQSG